MKKINALYFQSRWKKLVGQTLLHLTMAILLFCMIYPLAMSVWCAFKTTAEYDLSKFYPTLPMKISNLATAFSKVGGYMYNTVAVAVFGIAGSLFIASLASYAFAKMDFPGKALFFTMVLCLMMIPGVLTLVPQFLMYKGLNLNDSLFAILLPQWTMQPVGAVFLLSMFFKGLPDDLQRGENRRSDRFSGLSENGAAPVYPHFGDARHSADKRALERLYLAHDGHFYELRQAYHFGGVDRGVQESLFAEYARYLFGISHRFPAPVVGVFVRQ